MRETDTGDWERHQPWSPTAMRELYIVGVFIRDRVFVVELISSDGR